MKHRIFNVVNLYNKLRLPKEQFQYILEQLLLQLDTGKIPISYRQGSRIMGRVTKGTVLVDGDYIVGNIDYHVPEDRDFYKDREFSVNFLFSGKQNHVIVTHVSPNSTLL